jgi:hypothetical protein
MSTNFSTVANGQVTDAAQLNQVFPVIVNLETGKPFWGSTSTGSANVHVLATQPAISPLNAGQFVNFLPGYANTGPATLNVGTGAKPILLRGAALTAGAMITGSVIEAVFDGTSWHIIGGSTAAGGGGGNQYSGPIGQASITSDGSTSAGVAYDSGTLATVPSGTVSNGPFPSGAGSFSNTNPVFVCPTGTDSVACVLDFGRPIVNVPAPGQLVTVQVLRFQSGVSGTTFHASDSIYRSTPGQVIFSDYNDGSLHNKHTIFSTGRMPAAPGDFIACNLVAGTTVAVYGFSIVAYGT